MGSISNYYIIGIFGRRSKEESDKLQRALVTESFKQPYSRSSKFGLSATIRHSKICGGFPKIIT